MDFSNIINSACCDARVKKGIPDLNDPEFCFVLQEYLIKEGLDADLVAEKTYMLFEKGKFPERQAYNKDGILVTFPNKEYRDRAVDKGTHFASNPKHTDSNIFTDKDLSGTDSLSLADIRPEPEEEPTSQDTPTTDKPSNDVISVDNYVDSEVEDSDEDTRSKEEKSADAEAVDNMLVDDPMSVGNLPTYLDINEVSENYERYGMYGKDNKWYNTSGELIGEQIYDDKNNKFVIKLFSK